MPTLLIPAPAIGRGVETAGPGGSVPARSQRFASLDLFRGVFCLYVVLEHLGVALWTEEQAGVGLDGWFRHALVQGLNGNIASPMFFVISGFCMVASLESCRRQGRSAAGFLLRRAWRIFPSYWAALALFVGFVTGLDALGLQSWHQNDYSLELTSPAQLTPIQRLAAVSLTETWLDRSDRHPVVFTRVAWTLCYQEQFYLIGALALLVSLRRVHRALGALSVMLSAYVLFLWDSGAYAFWEGLFPYLWHLFAVGLAVYWRIHGIARPALRRLVEAGLLGLAGAAWSYGDRLTLAAALFGLALIGLWPHDAWLSGQRWLAPLRACGRISYSVYLIHLPVCVAVAGCLNALGVQGFWPRFALVLPLGLAASLLAGWIFDRCIDRHFVRLPQWGGGRPAPTAVRGPMVAAQVG